MMTRYELFKFLHVVGAVAWVGGGLGLFILHRRLVAVGDYTTLLAIGRQEKAIGNLLFAPAFVLTLGFGILMVATESWLSFADLWIVIGFGGIIASSALEMGVVQRAGKTLESLVSEHGSESREVATTIRTIGVGSAVSVAILLFVVWAMVAKPTL